MDITRDKIFDTKTKCWHERPVRFALAYERMKSFESPFENTFNCIHLLTVCGQEDVRFNIFLFFYWKFSPNRGIRFSLLIPPRHSYPCSEKRPNGLKLTVTEWMFVLADFCKIIPETEINMTYTQTHRANYSV